MDLQNLKAYTLIVKKELADASGSDDACVQMSAPGKVGGFSNREG